MDNHNETKDSAATAAPMRVTAAQLNELATNLLLSEPPTLVEASVRLTGGAAAAVYVMSELLQSAYGMAPEEVAAYLVVSGILREFDRIGLKTVADQILSEKAADV